MVIGICSRTGLGANIVQALAKQLKASVEIVQKDPGMMVSIQHTQVALVPEQSEASRELQAPIHPASAVVSG